MDSTNSCFRNKLSSGGLNSSGQDLCALVLILILFACVGLAGCGATSSNSPSGKGSAPTITSFTADPTSINSGTSSTLSWTAAGGDQYCHHAGDIHLHIHKRFNEHEPNGDNHLHTDRN